MIIMFQYCTLPLPNFGTIAYYLLLTHLFEAHAFDEYNFLYTLQEDAVNYAIGRWIRMSNTSVET